MNDSEKIGSLLNNEGFEVVITGVTLLNSLVEDEATLYDYIPCRDCSSKEELFEGEHSVYLALWTIGRLAGLGVEWVSGITELELEDSELTSLPEGLGNLTHLEALDLSYNELSSQFGSIRNA
jgi:Leucine-rich repeat (LRR) protein